MICVIDYGCGNLNSIKNAIDRLNFQCEVSSDPKIISKSDKIILQWNLINTIYQSHDNNLNQKYKVELNQRTIERVKKSF